MSKMRKNVSAYSGPVGDRNDCAVRALAVASGMPYRDAHAAFKRHGREDGKGTRWVISSRLYRELGYEQLDVKRVPAKFPKYDGHMVRPTIAKFAREHKEGAYILGTASHTLALVDGVVHDWRRGAGSRGQVVRAWRVK